MNKNERRVVKFAYLRDERDPRRVMTIARRWGKNGKKMHYAFTICNPVADQFRKATGRELAVQRLEANPWKIRPEQGAFVLRSIVLDIACRSCNIEDQRNAAEMTAQWLDENDRLLEEDFIRITEPEDNDCGSCEERCEGCGCQGMQAFCDRENSFQEEQLEGFKDQFRGALAVNLSSPSYEADFLQSLWVAFGGMITPQDILSALDSLTYADVVNVKNQHLTEENLFITAFEGNGSKG